MKVSPTLSRIPSDAAGDQNQREPLSPQPLSVTTDWIRDAVFILDRQLMIQHGQQNASFSFYPRDAMLARSLQQRRVCLSVRLSVSHTPVLCLVERKQDREMYTI